MAYMSFQERLARTVNDPGGVTDVMVDGERCPVDRLPERYGMTYDQYKARKEVQKQRVFCRLGDTSLSLVEFEAFHPHIELGQE